MITFSDLQSACGEVHEFANYFTAVCPFHDDRSPSLLVYKDGWFRCLGCQKQGTWKTLWNKLKGQPLQIMPERRSRWSLPGIPSEGLEDACYQAHMDLIGFPSLGWYLEMRGLEDRIETNELGFWEGWYTVPVRDENGEFEGAVFRAAPHIQEATGLRYWSPQHPLMFVPDWSLYHRAKPLIVVFGVLDALAVSSLRFPVATSTGGLNFDPAWLDDCRSTICIIPDKGEFAAARKLAAPLGWRAKVVDLDYPEGVKDPAGYLETGRRSELARLLGGL
jgi:hypothetical protein